jgi:hypothetical protein
MARLTSELISVINVWMAFVQLLYDAVSVCALDVNADGDVARAKTASASTRRQKQQEQHQKHLAVAWVYRQFGKYSYEHLRNI